MEEPISFKKMLIILKGIMVNVESFIKSNALVLYMANGQKKKSAGPKSRKKVLM